MPNRVNNFIVPKVEGRTVLQYKAGGGAKENGSIIKGGNDRDSQAFAYNKPI